MLLKLKYNKHFEVNRIKQTYDKIGWYSHHGYRPLLPNIPYDEEAIRSFVDTHFDSEKYKRLGEKLLLEFKDIRERFLSNLEKFFSKALPEKIELIITFYGVGGSYVLPNKVIVNVAGNQINKPFVNVLQHEIIHLLVETEVIKNKLSHSQKEALVSKIERTISFI